LVVEITARKRFSAQSKLIATIIPLDATASNSRIPQRKTVSVAQEA
jgi:hypothetical protein